MDSRLILAILAGVLAVMIATAVWADRVLPPSNSIPMQWGLDGKVNWSAPRRLGLAMLPLLYAVTMLPLLLLTGVIGGHSTGGLGGIGAISGTFLAIQWLHIWLVRRGGFGPGNR